MCSIQQPILPCPLCCQPNFSSVDSLRMSLVSVTNRPLMCPICSEVLLGLDKLTIHLFSHSLQQQPSPDPQPHQMVGPPPAIYLKDEINTIDAVLKIDETKIQHDPKTTESLKMVRRRRTKPSTIQNDQSSAIATASDVSIIDQPQCYICGCSFRTKELQRMHLRLVHEIFTIEPTPKVNAKNRLTSASVNRFSCDFCSKFFKNKGTLRVHLRVVHGVFTPATISKSGTNPKVNEIAEPKCLGVIGSDVQDDGSRMVDTSSMEISNRSPASSDNSPSESKQWECDICSKSFTTKYFLKKHKRLHTGEMPYTCKICSRTFTFQQSYHKHLLYHSDEKPHTCAVCGRAFKELSTLHNHERIHSGEKPYKCETCDKCFRQRVSYLVHRRIHTGVMPYKCTACDKSFRYKVSQRTHKCSAQPPGMVIRQAGDLVQKLIRQNGISPTEAHALSTLNPIINHPGQSFDGIEPQCQNSGSLHMEFAISQAQNLEQTHEPLTLDASNAAQLTSFIQSNQMLDKFVEESYNNLGIALASVDISTETASKCQTDASTAINLMNALNDIQIPSPSDKFQTLCLYSPQTSPSTTTATTATVADDLFTQTLETINEDSFKQLLYGNIDDLNHII